MRPCARRGRVGVGWGLGWLGWDVGRGEVTYPTDDDETFGLRTTTCEDAAGKGDGAGTQREVGGEGRGGGESVHVWTGLRADTHQRRARAGPLGGSRDAELRAEGELCAPQRFTQGANVHVFLRRVYRFREIIHSPSPFSGLRRPSSGSGLRRSASGPDGPEDGAAVREPALRLRRSRSRDKHKAPDGAAREAKGEASNAQPPQAPTHPTQHTTDAQHTRHTCAHCHAWHQHQSPSIPPQLTGTFPGAARRPRSGS